MRAALDIMFFVLLVLFLFATKLNVAQTVCSYAKTETIEVSYIDEVEVTESYIGSCRKYWYNVDCIKYRNVYKPEIAFKEKSITKLAHKCCEGYTQKGYACVPECDTPCENSTCIRPNECECIEGYVHYSSFKCVPHCVDCVNGECVGPGDCQCKTGYHRSDATHKCVPTCDSACQNGICSAPAECTCKPGFSQIDSSKDSDCSPFCNTECQNGICVAPDLCKCNAGYVAENLWSTQCKPVCEQNCGNGTCMAPNKCKCNAGYRAGGGDSDPYCIPQCDMDCSNGKCISPNTCKCLEGYEFVNSIGTNKSCVPYCDNCSHGLCISPGVCECAIGYFWKGGVCVPTCSKGCLNGKCVAPDVCSCDTGYKTNSTYACLPICEKECLNGSCTAPNVCSCNEGYTPNALTNVCTPFCVHECLNGTCVAPNICQCNDGFVYADSANECSPYCATPCPKGDCIAPNTCFVPPSDQNSFENQAETSTFEYSTIEDFTSSSFCVDFISMSMHCATDLIGCGCLAGYTPCNVTHCMPHCSLTCINSDCTQPEFCNCRQGYREGYNDTEWNICYAQCGEGEFGNSGCSNGNCIFPGHCECYDGFEKVSADNFRCVPCTGGHCTGNVNMISAGTSSNPIWLIVCGVLLLLGVATAAIAYVVYRRRRATSYPIDPIYYSCE